MKKRILFVFALFSMLTGFYGEDRIIEQSGINLQERVDADVRPPVITEKPKWYVASDGTEIIISVRFNSCVSPEITWMHNGNIIKEDSRHAMSMGESIAMLAIKKLVIEDAGTYTITVKNAGGKASASITLSFHEVTNILTFAL